MPSLTTDAKKAAVSASSLCRLWSAATEVLPLSRGQNNKQKMNLGAVLRAHGAFSNVSSVLRTAKIHLSHSQHAPQVASQANSRRSLSLIASLARNQRGFPAMIQGLRNTNRQAIERATMIPPIHESVARYSLCMVRSSLMSARIHISPCTSRSMTVTKKATQKVSRQKPASQNNNSPTRVTNEKDSYEYKAARSSSLMIRYAFRPQCLGIMFCTHACCLSSRCFNLP
jgi:hypothetical protein